MLSFPFIAAETEAQTCPSHQWLSDRSQGPSRSGCSGQGSLCGSCVFSRPLGRPGPDPGISAQQHMPPGHRAPRPGLGAARFQSG